MEKKIVKFGAWDTEIKEENGIITFEGMSSTNNHFEKEDNCLLTEIEGKKFKVCYLGSEEYLKYEIKSHLRDDVSYNDFKAAVYDAGESWRTSANVLTLIEDIEYHFKDGTVRYGFNNIVYHGENLLGLIPVNSTLKIRVEYNLSFNEDEYEQTVIKEAI